MITIKTYTIIGGVNGVGKSSFTGSLKAQTNNLGMIIDVDKITAENGCDLIKGGKIAITKINECLNNGYSFTQETTLSGAKTEKTARIARENGYYIRLFYIGLDTLDESIERIKNRVAKGGHNINSESVEHRFENRFESLIKVLPYCDEAIFFDNRNGFIKVAEYNNGELILTANNPPLWIKELQTKL